MSSPNERPNADGNASSVVAHAAESARKAADEKSSRIAEAPGSWQPGELATLTAGRTPIGGDRVRVEGPVAQHAGMVYVTSPPGEGLAFMVKGTDLMRDAVKAQDEPARVPATPTPAPPVPAIEPHAQGS